MCASQARWQRQSATIDDGLHDLRVGEFTVLLGVVWSSVGMLAIAMGLSGGPQCSASRVG